MLNHRSSWLTKFIESAHILRSYLGSIRPNHTRICVVVPQTKCCCLICLILLLFDVQWFGSVFIIWRRRKTYIFICLLFEIFPFDFVPHEANNHPKIVLTYWACKFWTSTISNQHTDYEHCEHNFNWLKMKNRI